MPQPKKNYNRREVPMMDPDMQWVCVNGQEWVVKREDDHYFYRPEGDYGKWTPGTPPGIHERDMDNMFRTN